MSLENSDLAAVAKIIKIWGLKGELKALPLTKNIELLQPESSVHILTPDGIQKKEKIKKIRKHHKYLIISFHNITDPESALYYKDSTIIIEKSLLPPLKEGEFYHEQIIGLNVITSDGDTVGIVDSILETGSNDVYVVKQDDKEYLIPAIKDVIKQIDVEKGIIVIQVINGLLD